MLALNASVSYAKRPRREATSIVWPLFELVISIETMEGLKVYNGLNDIPFGFNLKADIGAGYYARIKGGVSLKGY